MNKNLSLIHLWSTAARLFTALLLTIIGTGAALAATKTCTVVYNVYCNDPSAIAALGGKYCSTAPSSAWGSGSTSNFTMTFSNTTESSGSYQGYYKATITISDKYYSGFSSTADATILNIEPASNCHILTISGDKTFSGDTTSSVELDNTKYTGNATKNYKVDAYPEVEKTATKTVNMNFSLNSNATVTWNGTAVTGSTDSRSISSSYYTLNGVYLKGDNNPNFDNTITVTNSQASETTTVEYTLAKSGNTLAHGELTKGSSEDITWNTGDANAADYNGATLTIVSHTVTITTENASNTVTLNFSNEDSSLCSLAWSANDSESFSQNVAVTEAQHSISKPYVITYVNGEYNSETDRHFNNVIKATLPDGYVAKWKIEKNNTILANGNIKGSGSAVNTATWNTADADYDGATFTVFDIIDNPYAVEDYDGTNFKFWIIADPALVTLSLKYKVNNVNQFNPITLDPSGETLFSLPEGVSFTEASGLTFQAAAVAQPDNAEVTIYNISFEENNGRIHTGSSTYVDPDGTGRESGQLYVNSANFTVVSNYSYYGNPKEGSNVCENAFSTSHGGFLRVDATKLSEKPKVTIWTDDKSKFTVRFGADEKTMTSNETEFEIPQTTTGRTVYIMPNSGVELYKVLYNGEEQTMRSASNESGNNSSYYQVQIQYIENERIEVYAILPTTKQNMVITCNIPAFVKQVKFGPDSETLESELDEEEILEQQQFDFGTYVRFICDIDNYDVNSFTINGEAESLYSWASSAPGEYGKKLNDKDGALYTVAFNVTPIARDITVNYSTQGSKFSYTLIDKTESTINPTRTNKTVTCKLTRADNTRFFFTAGKTGTFTISESENPVELDFTQCSDVVNQPNNLNVYLNGVRIIYGAVDGDGEYDPDNSNLYWKGNLVNGDDLKIVWYLNDVTISTSGIGDNQTVNTSYNQATTPDQHHVTFVNDGMNIHPDIQAGEAFVVSTRNESDLTWDDSLDGYVMPNTILVIKPHTYTNEQGQLQTSKIHSVTVESAGANSVRRRAAANTGFGTFYPDGEGKVEVEITGPSRITIHGDNNTTGVEEVAIEGASATSGNVYSLSGVLLRTDGNTADLPAGIYIVDGKKVAVK